HTVTFIGLKPGLLTLDGPDHCGTLHVADLAIDAAGLLPPHGSIIGQALLRDAVRPRALNTHKGDFGSVGIVGGATGMVGAALLAGRAALKAGAGRVYLGLLAAGAPAVDFVQPELMLRASDEVLALQHLTALAVGPGLGQNEAALSVLSRALESTVPLVIDADGLNLIGARNGLKQTLQARKAPTVLTPHPAEAARLLGCRTDEVQGDRLAAALRLASSLCCGVVLKGAGSICAWPDGTWAINDSGNPGMASAGMGDVLTGLIAALLAQGCDARTALAAGVHLHGAAADDLVAQGHGPVGLTAGELVDAARSLINRRER
ncbi:MAG TPA: NAD(P)H-hydrate dehydratase, partial [Burkholderiales bacterium]|nr:NAD(P)H-hydrate dehydratase [Burkholderiales bacterium]